jgi:hypothetical protein
MLAVALNEQRQNNKWVTNDDANSQSAYHIPSANVGRLFLKWKYFGPEDPWNAREEETETMIDSDRAVFGQLFHNLWNVRIFRKVCVNSLEVFNHEKKLSYSKIA